MAQLKLLPSSSQGSPNQALSLRVSLHPSNTPPTLSNQRRVQATRINRLVRVNRVQYTHSHHLDMNSRSGGLTPPPPVDEFPDSLPVSEASAEPEPQGSEHPPLLRFSQFVTPYNKAFKEAITLQLLRRRIIFEPSESRP